MLKCSQPGCTANALGWGVLKSGGSTVVATCAAHTAPALLANLRDYNPAAAAPAPTLAQVEAEVQQLKSAASSPVVNPSTTKVK